MEKNGVWNIELPTISYHIQKMGIDVGELVNDMSNKFLSMPIFSTIANNPIYTALTITFIIMLIVAVVFRHADTEESKSVMVIRCGFIVFMSTVGIMLLHNKVLTEESLGVKKAGAYDELFSANPFQPGMHPADRATGGGSTVQSNFEGPPQAYGGAQNYAPPQSSYGNDTF